MNNQSSESNCVINIFLILLAIIYFSFSSIIAIVSLVIAFKNHNDICINNNSDISYYTYLCVFGFFTISTNIINFIFILLIINNVKIKIFASLSNGLFFLFDFSWYIVGSVIYFENIYNCNSIKIIRDFGLALFIIKTISFFIYCCCNKSLNNENQNVESQV